jgi:hypothetical protein
MLDRVSATDLGVVFFIIFIPMTRFGALDAFDPFLPLPPQAAPFFPLPPALPPAFTDVTHAVAVGLFIFLVGLLVGATGAEVGFFFSWVGGRDWKITSCDGLALVLGDEEGGVLKLGRLDGRWLGRELGAKELDGA